MIAMVMCAGEGTRLRPLTYALPKPMMPIANKPALEHTLNNLRRHGIREAVINVSYMPEMIPRFCGDGSRWGMKLHFSVERRLLGTAGGVKRVERIFRRDPDPDFLVTSGDGLTDVDFTRLVDFHKRKRSFGTIALKKVESRFEYGVVETGPGGRIRKFVEKPSWGDVFSNCVNTGIYLFNKKVFDSIPASVPFDFGRQVWPALLARHKPIYGTEINEFWTDIGNIGEYRRAAWAVLEKEVDVRISEREVRPRVWIGRNSKIEPGVRILPPCLIGDDCTIGKNATIGSHAVIGRGSKIGSRAVIKNSILWDGVAVAQKVYLENCIIGTKGRVTEDISVFEAALIDMKGH